MQDPHRARSLVFHPNAPAVVRFDAFRFDLTDGSLWRDSVEVKLPPRALVVLQHLVERAGRVVAKQALIEAAWKDAYVGDASLTEAIGLIRQALGDDPQQPRYIQTVYRRGYRFVAPIAIDAAAAAPPTAVAPPEIADRARANAPSSPNLAMETQTGSDAVTASATSRAIETPEDTLASHSTRARHDAHGAAQASGTLDAPLQRRGARGRSTWPLTPIALGAAALVAIAGVGVLVWLSRAPAPVAPAVRLSLTLPADQAPAPGANAHPVAAISPDGTRVIYTAGPAGASRLYVRRMDQFTASPLAGTDEGHGPFVSPDGRWVAFFGDGHLKKIPIDGGEPQVLCVVPTGVGGVWLSDDEIVFAPDWITGLQRVSAAGGVPSAAATPAKGYSYRWPDRIDARTVLATRWRTNARDAAVVMIALASGAETMIAERAVFGRYVTAPDGGGIVVFVRDSAVHAVRVDRVTRAAVGTPVQVDQAVLTGTTGAAQFAIAPAGTLLYIPEDETRLHRVLARRDAAGRVIDLPIAPRAFRNLTVCKDKLAVTIYDHGQSDLWVGQLDRAALTRLTHEGSVYEPVWTADCGTLTFAWNRTGISAMHEITLGTGSPPRRRPENPADSITHMPGSWSADGRLLGFMRMDRKTDPDLWVADVTTRTMRPVRATPAQEILPRLSPDGRWMAYESDAVGHFEIEIASLASGARMQVSTGGGIWPAWSADGRQLFYLHEGTIYRMDVAARNGEPAPTNPVAAYAHPDLVLFRPTSVNAAHDGFVLVRRTTEHLPLTRLDLVLNWFGELQARVR